MTWDPVLAAILGAAFGAFMTIFLQQECPKLVELTSQERAIYSDCMKRMTASCRRWPEIMEKIEHNRQVTR